MRFRHRRIAVLAAATALIAGVAVALAPSSVAAPGLTATFAKTSDWGTGAEGKYTIRNGGSSPVNGWTVEFDLPAGTTLGSYWDALLTESGGHVTARNREWNGTLGAGAATSFGFLLSGGGSPANCRINGAACDGSGGGGDTQAPTAPANLRATGTTSSSVSLTWTAATDDVGVSGYEVQRDGATAVTVTGTSATVSGLAGGTAYQFRVRARDAAGNTSGYSNTVSATTQPGGGGGSGAMAAAPYLYAWGEPPSPATVMNATGVKWFTLAFVLSDGGCNPAWDGTGPITGGWHAQQIGAIRAAGGDVIPSFGGWSGNKLGERCGDAGSLADAYQRVVDAFNLKAIDIDIEASEFENEAVQDRVLTALKLVKQRRPGIKTIVTFGTGQDGPNWWGQRLIRRGAELGANIDVWTIMPFDFGAGGADMGQATIRAADGLKNYVRSTHGYSDADAYRHSGVSGMNGLSDQREVSTLDDYREILAYANQRRLGRFTFWSVNRDRPCAGQVAGHCSGLTNHQNWDYTRIVAQYAG